MSRADRKNGYVPPGLPISRTPEQVDMAAFDRLPRAIRDAINDAPFNLDASSAEENVRRYGEAFVRAAIRQLVVRALEMERGR